MRTYIALFKNNMRLTLRDRSALFFNYLFPFIFFFAFGQLFHAGTGMGIAYFVGTVLTMGILGNGLWGAGMRAVQEREQNILRRYKVTPITPLPILLSSMVSGWLLYLPVLVMLIVVAHFGYAMAWPRNWISLFLMTSLGVCAFRAIGLILAAVTNTMQEATILIQLLYMPMLFLSGTTFPAAILPGWAQTLAEFLPAAYLVTGFQGIFFRNQTLLDNLIPVGALLLTVVVGVFIAVQLFRWEKEDKLKAQRKLWVLAVLAPFLVLGCYRAYSRDHIGQNQAMFRDLQRSGVFLIRNTRVVVGDGQIIEIGSVLVRAGKIEDIYPGAGPDPDSIKAEIIEGAGKTLMPGFIDAHVHLGGNGAVWNEYADYSTDKYMVRADSSLLFSGVTSVRSLGDELSASLAHRKKIAGGERLGAQPFLTGPIFTAPGSSGVYFIPLLPEALKPRVKSQLLLTPKSAAEARQQVRDLKRAGVDGIKLVLEGATFDGSAPVRIDLAIAKAIAEEARASNLPMAVHTADTRDVADAVELGASSIEHGSWTGDIPDDLLAQMARRNIYFDPTLAVAEAYWHFYGGKADLLNDSLLQQVVPAASLKTTRDVLASGKTIDPAKAVRFAQALQQARTNLTRAWKAGVPLVVGTDAGSPLMTRGPSFHREIQLWSEAGIPSWSILQSATANTAKLLRAERQIGAIRKGLDADLLLVDGNPLTDITATEHISLVVFKGERVHRQDLFDQQ